MTKTEFLVALALGASAIAIWIHMRFPSIAPEGLRTAIIHVGIALIVGQAIFPAFEAILPEMNPFARALVMTFLLGLPVLIYSLLSSIWIIRILQGALNRR
jgi:hypothetical protein